MFRSEALGRPNEPENLLKSGQVQRCPGERSAAGTRRKGFAGHTDWRTLCLGTAARALVRARRASRLLRVTHHLEVVGQGFNVWKRWIANASCIVLVEFQS